MVVLRQTFGGMTKVQVSVRSTLQREEKVVKQVIEGQFTKSAFLKMSDNPKHSTQLSTKRT